MGDVVVKDPMSNLNSEAQAARKLLAALNKVLVKYPNAFKGSGAKTHGSGKTGQPLDSRQIAAAGKMIARNDIRVEKAEAKLKEAIVKRDEHLAAKLESARATREWLQFQYADPNDPVRAFFEER